MRNCYETQKGKTMFKNGDRVRLTKNYGAFGKSEIGFIEEIRSPLTAIVQFDSDDCGIFVPIELLELIPETTDNGNTMFKIGDKVRLTEDFHYFRKGDTGTVDSPYFDSSTAFYVRFDKKIDNCQKISVATTAILELIPETTNKGKTMNTREAYQALLNGETLVAKNGNEYYLEKDSGILCLYHNHASFVSRNILLSSPSDLSIKQKTININGFEVPEPFRDASDCYGSLIYYIPSLTNSNGVSHCNWISSEEDYKFLNAGLVHLTEENAAKHAEALLSFTKKD